ncbi:MAG TPA: DUF4132 domain-containing protein [Verrucomicrobiae bacterium]|nr:DUF4132 domain-containing protein [Verrucomicrobiae bacterium]
MFGRLKKSAKEGLDPVKRAAVLQAVSQHFLSLEEDKNGLPGIAGRLARFVVEDEDRAAPNDLTLHLANRQYNGWQTSQGFVQHHKDKVRAFFHGLPRDAELYLRLAQVYEALYSPRRTSWAGSIPNLNSQFDGLKSFLLFVAETAADKEKNVDIEMVESMLDAKSVDAGALVTGAFVVEDAQGKWQHWSWLALPYSIFSRVEGFSSLVARYPDIVRKGFAQSNAGARAYSLNALRYLASDTTPFADEIAVMAVGGSKEVREAAEPFIAAAFEGYGSRLEAKATKGTSDERYNAVRLLARLGGDKIRPFLEERLKVEKASKVAETLQDVLNGSRSKQGSDAADGPEVFGLSPSPPVAVKAPLDPAVFDELRACIDEYERKAEEEHSRNEWAKKNNYKFVPLPPDTAVRLFKELQELQVTGDKQWPNLHHSYSGNNFQMLQKFAAHPAFELIHLVRWCLLLSGRTKDPRTGTWQHWSIRHSWGRPFQLYQKSRKRPIDLRELAAVLKAIRLEETLIGDEICQHFYGPRLFSFNDPETVWPYFAEHMFLLAEAFGTQQIPSNRRPTWLDEKRLRSNAFEILNLFPRIPGRFVPMLWDVALGPSKTERPLAQRCLNKRKGREEQIIAAVKSRQIDARIAAAEWLADLKYKPAIPALKSALANEKSEIARDEQMRSLETLGVRLEDLLDVKQLEEDAEKGLKKGVPSDLEWFPFSQLPAVRWADSGKRVPPRIIEWFLMQGYRLKDAEANPLLRRYCSLFRKDDRERLGRFVLDAWIAKDTKPKHTSDQAAVLAEQETAQVAGWAQKTPQYYKDFDRQKYYQAAFNRFLVQPEGSQIGTKGILAVSGACCGPDVAQIVHRYIKQWFGYRGAQGKALLQVLAWIDHPAAIQVILAVANRFRTKGIQEEANRLCQVLAERKGWTLDELADRTIPSAGLDEQGIMELDYGSRVFTVHLMPDMNFELSNLAGKTIASLPDANQSDDAEKSKAAKAMLSAARKELKQVLTMQRDRLYEALCTQRTWRFEEWDTYLRQHPIVGRYCQRLVWAVWDGDKAAASFRPMDDGSLTSNEDDAVTVDADATIRLAHEQTIGKDAAAAWVSHFADYKVEPLFHQFGKESYTLPAELKEETELKQFHGHLVKAFSLRNRLTKLGYSRGQPIDGGWFMEYRKGFAGLGFAAVIEFTGNTLPEENRTVALLRLFFERRSPGDGQGIAEEIPLGELPTVLLSECWNDVRMAAAEGSGFAEDWQKQSEY